MLAVWIAAAFALGLLARQLGLPPLVGFLAAGFLLNAIRCRARSRSSTDVAHLGVLLLLFSVGLKLRFKNLLRAEVWGVGMPAVRGGACSVALHWPCAGSPASPLGALVAAPACLSFSSTVLAAKILEERREIRAFHGRVAIGILIVQDLIAVAILGVNEGPSAGLAGWPSLLPLASRWSASCWTWRATANCWCCSAACWRWASAATASRPSGCRVNSARC